MKNEHYEEILYNDILVDCHGQEEEQTSWFYYLEEVMEFPFKASINIKNANKKQVSKKITVLDISMNNTNPAILVEIKFDDYILEMPIEKLEEIEASEEGIQAIEIRKYWIKRINGLLR